MKLPLSRQPVSPVLSSRLGGLILRLDKRQYAIKGQIRSYSTSINNDIDSILLEINKPTSKLPKVAKVYSNLADLDTIIQIEQENRNKQGVYGLLNTKNKKLYIGSARDITKRFKEHYRGE